MVSNIPATVAPLETIDTGCLIVRTAEGRRVPIAAGEVFFGPVRSVGAA